MQNDNVLPSDSRFETQGQDIHKRIFRTFESAKGKWRNGFRRCLEGEEAYCSRLPAPRVPGETQLYLRQHQAFQLCDLFLEGTVKYSPGAGPGVVSQATLSTSAMTALASSAWPPCSFMDTDLCGCFVLSYCIFASSSLFRSMCRLLALNV